MYECVTNGTIVCSFAETRGLSHKAPSRFSLRLFSALQLEDLAQGFREVVWGYKGESFGFCLVRGREVGMDPKHWMLTALGPWILPSQATEPLLLDSRAPAE